MPVKIDSISFVNFRQYKNISYNFPNDNKYNLHVFEAKNGTGKTTFLNAITWCLYGVEKYVIDEERALPIANDSVVNNAKEDDTITASVDIRIKDIDNNTFIDFKREQKYKIKYNPINGNKKAIGDTSNLVVSVTEIGSPENSKIYTDELEGRIIVDQYFNQSIFDYYFFDGENLKNYFVSGKSERIKESIFNISQVNLLKATKDRASTMATEKSREAYKKDPGVLDIIKEKTELINEINTRKGEIQKANNDLPLYRSRKAAAEDILNNYKPVKLQQIRKYDKNQELLNLQIKQKEVLREKNEFIQEYLVLLNFYPRIKSTYDMICRKEERNELPPNIDTKEIKSILDEHLKYCPVCNSELDERAYNFLQDLLNKSDVSNETSHSLMKIKGSLEEMIEETKKYEQKRKRIIENERKLNQNISDVNRELEEIHAFLVNYPESDSESKISQAEKDSKYFGDKIEECNSIIVKNNALNKRDESRLEDIEKEIKKADAKKTEKNILDIQSKIYSKVSESLGIILNKIMLTMKNEIKENTWKMFDSMIWKKYTFKSIGINDNYEMSVTNIHDKEMIGHLGATEYMALAYSFTLAIHQASGRNCPLVVDSPLGRVSDENRKNMASCLLNVSKEKQIIMLFTPDEYSDEVKEVFAENVASYRLIKLSDNEEHIEKVGE